MNTKKCEKCGWVYPINHPDMKCRFCGTIFKKRFCVWCGAYTTLRPNTNKCIQCNSKQLMGYITAEAYNAYSRAGTHRARDKAIAAFNAWLNKINKLQLKTLTESEWIAACKHFGKCAMCGG